jgi:peptide/nickel transport system substrate-binding protein
MKRLGLLLSLVMIASMLAACGATPEPQVIEKEVEKVVTEIVEQKVVETVIVAGTPEVVEKTIEKVVTTTPEPEPAPVEEVVKEGGTFIMGYSELGRPNLNPYTGIGWSTFHPWQQPFLEGLVSWDPQGNPVPRLATEVPSLENGLISEDGTTITYPLRPDVKWADGEPFTCDDVRFTIEALQNPDNIVHSHAGVEFIEEVQCPDDLTAVFKFTEYFAPWPTVPELVLPEHVLSQYPDMNDVPWNQLPFGTGPFVVAEHVLGDHITYEPNPYYWLEGHPIIDKYIMLFISNKSAGIERFAAGEIDAYYYTEEDSLPQVRRIESDYELWAPESNDFNYMYMNTSPSSGPNVGDPDYPNPVTGDVRVRQAIDFAIDKQFLCDKFRAGASHPIGSFWPVGALSPDQDPRPFDLDKAKELLEEAGWTDTDEDGIRECHGCLYANEGDPMTLKIVANAGSKEYLLVCQYVQYALRDIGFDATVESAPSSVISAPRSSGGIYSTGTFDLIMSGTKAPPDPAGEFVRLFHSSRACIEGECTNRSRYRNPEVDELILVAQTEKDPEARKTALDELHAIIQRDVPMLWLYSRKRMVLHKPYVKGLSGPYDEPNGFLWGTSNLEYVWLDK